MMALSRKDWVLAGSLALNLFLVGAVTPPLVLGLMHRFDRPGHGFGMGGPGGPGGWGGGPGGGPSGGPGGGPGGFERLLTLGLSDADAAIIKSVIRPRERFADMRFAMRKTVGAAQAALKADPFDPQALAKALAEGSEARAGFERDAHAALVDAATRLTPEGRRRLAELPMVLGEGGPPPGGRPGKRPGSDADESPSEPGAPDAPQQPATESSPPGPKP